MKSKFLTNNIIIVIISLTFLISCKIDNSNETSVENVKVQKDNKFAWAVVGSIRNVSDSEINGYVKIKFLTSNGDIVNTAKTKVNDGDSFSSGQAASFEYYTEPSNFDNVTDFDVEFIAQ